MAEGANYRTLKKRGLWLNAWKRFKRNKRALVGLVIIVLLVLVAIFAKHIAPYGYDDQNMDIALQHPSWSHIFGTDNLGRDIFSRLVYGSQISLELGIISVGISLVVGGSIGAVSGFYSGKVDMVIMRVMDIFQSIPAILLAIVIAASLGSGIFNAMIAIGVSNIPIYARLMRGSMLSVRESEYVKAARAITAGDGRIIFKHIVPNVMSPMIVQITLGFAGAVIMAATLSFLGLGAQPPSPEWGAMITGARNYLLNYGYMVMFPGLTIMLTVVSFNLIGDGLRDALDPRMKR